MSFSLRKKKLFLLSSRFHVCLQLLVTDYCMLGPEGMWRNTPVSDCCVLKTSVAVNERGQISPKFNHTNKFFEKISKPISSY